MKSNRTFYRTISFHILQARTTYSTNTRDRRTCNSRLKWLANALKFSTLVRIRLEYGDYVVRAIAALLIFITDIGELFRRNVCIYIYIHKIKYNTAIDTVSISLSQIILSNVAQWIPWTVYVQYTWIRGHRHHHHIIIICPDYKSNV